MAVQLSPSYLRRSFQLLAKLDAARMPEDEAFDRAGNIVYEWAKRKFSRIFRKMPYQKTTFDDKRDGNELGLLWDEGGQRFILRGAHPDTRVPGRMWITDVQLSPAADGGCLFAVRLSVTSLHACTEEIPFSCPQFVRLVADNIGLCDVIPVSRQVRVLSTQEEVDAFLDVLEDQVRQLPAVVVTPCHREDGDAAETYMMDAERLAVDLYGVAHVFQMTWEANRYFTARVGKQWSAFSGAVRTYYPGVHFDDMDYYQHPLLTRQSISLWTEEGGPDQCIRELEGRVMDRTRSRALPWEEKGVAFYLAAHQNYLREQRARSARSERELIDSYEEQLEQMQKQCDECLSLADSYAKDLEICTDENERQRQTIGKLKARIETLQFQLETALGEDAGQGVPEDGSYEEIGEWIEEHYPERLVLHPRAARSLKSAVYADTGLVYRCLKLLATSYYDYCRGAVDYNAFMRACKAVDPGLDERGAITDVAAGMQGDTYYVEYGGKKHKLERHLAKGSSKDQRYCLRIYYFWDEQEKAVVIGDLPHHLDTSAT